MKLTYDVNEKIKALEVRVQGRNGEQLGVMATSQAQELANEAGLDLVQINATSNPPICRIIEFGKFKYELSLREKEQKRKLRENTVNTKVIQLRPVTDTHDLTVKAKRGVEFLGEGDKVKIVVRFKGREAAHSDMGRSVIDQFLTMVGDHRIDSPVIMAGRQMSVTIAASKK